MADMKKELKDSKNRKTIRLTEKQIKKWDVEKIREFLDGRQTSADMADIESFKTKYNQLIDWILVGKLKNDNMTKKDIQILDGIDKW